MKVEDIIFYSVGIITIITGVAFAIIEIVKDWKENRRD